MTVFPRLPVQTLAELSGLGATFFCNGILIVIPHEASSADINAAADLMDRLFNERYVAEGADQGFGS